MKEQSDGPRAAFVVALPQADNNWSWTHQNGTVPPAVGLMVDASLERNPELPGDVTGTQGQ